MPPSKKNSAIGVKVEANAAEISAESTAALAAAIVDLMNAGFATNADQETIRQAIKSFTEITSKALINGVTISESNFTSS